MQVHRNPLATLNHILVQRIFTYLLQVIVLVHSFEVCDINGVTRFALIEGHLVKPLALAAAEENFFPLWVSSQTVVHHPFLTHLRTALGEIKRRSHIKVTTLHLHKVGRCSRAHHARRCILGQSPIIVAGGCRLQVAKRLHVLHQLGLADHTIRVVFVTT